MQIQIRIQIQVILIMEYLDGGELFERVADEDFNLTESDCCLFMRQICRGVQYLHDHNIVHLDLKVIETPILNTKWIMMSVFFSRGNNHIFTQLYTTTTFQRLCERIASFCKSYIFPLLCCMFRLL